MTKSVREDLVQDNCNSMGQEYHTLPLMHARGLYFGERYLYEVKWGVMDTVIEDLHG